MTDKELLEEYEKEFGCITPMTVESLIESHREHRKRLKEWRDKYAEDMDAGYKVGEQRGFEHATEHNFVSIERLKKMSLKEISDLIEENG